MHDKENNYQFDDEFTHQSWLKMQAQLDEVMPVDKRKKRRALLWWWGSGLVAAVLLGLWFLPIRQSDEVMKNEVATPSIVETKTTPATSIAEEEGVNLFVPKKDKKIKENTTAIAAQNTTGTSIQKPSKTTNAVSKNNTTKNTQKEVVETFYESEKINNSLAEKQPIANQSNVLNQPFETPSTEFSASANTLTQQDKNITEYKIRNDINVNYLYGFQQVDFALPLLPIVYESDWSVMNLSTNEINKKDWKNPLRWGIVAALYNGLGIEQSGIATGLALAKPLSSRWELQTGLQYQWSRSNHLISSSTELLFDQAGTAEAYSAEDLDLTTNNRGVNATSFESIVTARGELYNSITSQVKFQQIGLPINLLYRLSPKWDVAAGMQVNYLTRIVSTRSDGRFSASANPSTNALDQGENITNAFNFNVIRRWDLAANASVHYRLSKHFDMGLSYQRVLQANRNHVPVENASLQQDALRLQLVYWW